MIKRIYKSAADKISASRYGTAVIDGKKLSSTKLKKHILEEIKSGGISSEKLDDVLKEEGMNKMQIAKRKRLIKRLTGTDVVKLSKKEIQKHALRVKMRIKAALQTEGMGSRHGGMASKNERKKEALKKALGGPDKKNAPENNGVVSGLGSGGAATIGGASTGPAPTTGSTGPSGPPIGFNKTF